MDSFDAALHAQSLRQLRHENQPGLRSSDHILETHPGETCKLCNAGPDVDFSMAFQPIADTNSGSIFAYEALTRGLHGEPAGTILDRTLHNNKYAMDQRCREKAITLSSSLGLLETPADLSINFYPNAVYEPRQCLSRTLNAANSVGFPLERIIFEITEVEQVRSHDHLRNIMTEYQRFGLRVAIDDFGAGHSGLTLLSIFQPDIIKIDQALIHDIDQRPASRSIVRSLVQICTDLNIRIIAEGIERKQEMQALCDLGIHLMQGFYFAPPAFEALPAWPLPPT
jgi:EAL domain-containing protein (putative c-di-GMP-specific phosphodiesterase class I)